MYDKYKTHMKTLVIATITALLTMSSSEPVAEQDTIQNQSILDENFFKQELQQSILEFCRDAGIDPDSVYMPFRDEL